MPNRRMSTYNIVFTKIKEYLPQLNPQLIITDFEAALIKSLETHFPLAKKTGCFFHYGQAIVRQAGVLDMRRLISENTNAKKALKCIIVLALLPAEKIEDGVDYIHSFLRGKNLLNDFEILIRYYQRQWLRRVGVKSISVYQRARRTNNDCESFHLTLIRTLRLRGPNVWEFTDGLRNIAAVTVRELESFLQGLQIRSLPKRKYQLNDKRIKDATKLLDEGELEVGSFLHMVGYCAEGLVARTLDSNLDGENNDTEEQLLTAVEGNLPNGFDIVQDASQDDEAAEVPGEEEDTEEQSETPQQQERPQQQEHLDSPICIICQERPPTNVLLPCKHFGICDECKETLKRFDNTPQRPDPEWGHTFNYAICPLDRTPIETFLRVNTT